MAGICTIIRLGRAYCEKGELNKAGNKALNGLKEEIQKISDWRAFRLWFGTAKQKLLSESGFVVKEDDLKFVQILLAHNVCEEIKRG